MNSIGRCGVRQGDETHQPRFALFHQRPTMMERMPIAPSFSRFSRNDRCCLQIKPNRSDGGSQQVPAGSSRANKIALMGSLNTSQRSLQSDAALSVNTVIQSYLPLPLRTKISVSSQQISLRSVRYSRCRRPPPNINRNMRRSTTLKCGKSTATRQSDVIPSPMKN